MSHAAKILSHRALRRRHLAGLIVMATLILWAVVWGFTAYHFNQMIDDMITSAKAKGVMLAFDRRFTNGTPFAVHIQLDRFSLQTSSGARLQSGEAVFYLDLWDWMSISGKLRDGIDGVLAGTPFKAGIIKFGFEQPEYAPLDHTETGLAFWIQPLALSLTTETPLPFGNDVAEGLFRVRIMGPVPNFTSKDSVAAWNSASGVLEFDRFFLQWGAVTVTASGTVGFDANLQPEGAFSGRIDGLDEAIELLTSQDILTEREATLARSSVHVLSRPVGLTGSSASIVPISLQKGSLYLGPVRFLTLPELKW